MELEHSYWGLNNGAGRTTKAKNRVSNGQGY